MSNLARVPPTVVPAPALRAVCVCAFCIPHLPAGPRFLAGSPLRRAEGSCRLGSRFPLGRQVRFRDSDGVHRTPEIGDGGATHARSPATQWNAGTRPVRRLRLRFLHPASASGAALFGGKPAPAGRRVLLAQFPLPPEPPGPVSAPVGTGAPDCRNRRWRRYRGGLPQRT